jgi:hypothetical protein
MDSFVAAAIHDAKNGLNALNVWLEEARRTNPSLALDKAEAISARVSAQLVELLALYRADQGTLRMAVDDHAVDEFLANWGRHRTALRLRQTRPLRPPSAPGPSTPTRSSSYCSTPCATPCAMRPRTCPSPSRQKRAAASASPSPTMGRAIRTACSPARKRP